MKVEFKEKIVKLVEMDDILLKKYYIKRWSKGDLWGNYLLIGNVRRIHEFIDKFEMKISGVQTIQEGYNKCFLYLSGEDILDEMIKIMSKGQIGYDHIAKKYMNNRIIVLEDLDKISYYQREYIVSIFHWWRKYSEGGMLFVVSKKNIDMGNNDFRKLFF